jgi:3-oxoadipate enol-lactonase
METVTHNGRDTSYRATGFGDEAPVLYVHGSGGTHQVWVGQYGDREHPRPAVALDLSGHGDSADTGAAPGPEALDAYADDVVAVARETGAGVLCGNSLGGAIALHVALERDLPLDGLVLADTGAKLSVHPDLLEWLQTDFDRAVEFLHGEDFLFHDPTEEAEAASKAAMYECGSAVTYRDFETCNRFDVRDRLGEVEVPTLAVCGEHDRLTPPKFHHYLADQLPDCEAVELADAAHLPFVERPTAFNAAVGAFLDGL